MPVESSRGRTVGDLMSRPVVTAEPSETIAAASARMVAAGVGSVVVVDGRRPIGILTERDLVRFAATGADASGTKVSEWMTAHPDTVGPEVEVAHAFAGLAEHGYRHIPVVEGGELVGIVSMRDLMRVAQIRPVDSFTEVPKGLEGVVVAETAVGDVRGLEGFYHYRQYSAVELAKQRTLEDVWFLMVEGRLPDREERRRFLEEVAPLRAVPERVRPLLPEISASGDPLTSLRTAVSATAAVLGFKPVLDIDATRLRDDALRVAAVVPTLIMACHRLARGLEPIEPRPDLPTAANYLYMLTGEEPDPEKARALEQYLITTVDHGFNASTFTARVIASTGADLGAAIVGAIGALSGPLHGGAPGRALEMLDRIGTPERAEEYVRDAVARGERIMGFGHRVYKTDDPRSVFLRSVAERLGGELVALAEQVENTVVQVLGELKPGRRLYTNVEFYAGLVMDACGIPRELFTPTFAASRTIGWCAHVLEQASDNRLIRPSARYVGPPPPEPIPPLKD